VTPIKRRDVAIGKILSLGIAALCSGASSFLGLYFSMPKMMQISGGDADTIADMSMYGWLEYVLLALVVFATALLLVSFISILSSFAKTVKEAMTLVTPFMIVVMLVGIIPMFGSGAQTEIVYYLIPIYNSVESMAGIFAQEFVTANVLVSVLSNLIYTMVAVFVLSKLFNNEKVMFSK
jgi:sodium transport system permease protein